MRVAETLVALCYKPEGLGFDYLWCHWNFFIDKPPSRTMVLGLTQPLTEISTRNNSCGVEDDGA
jgi:hypothetical protein